MKIYDENSLYDELVSRYDLDISDISSYFKMYDVDAVINKLNKGKITIDSLYDGMAQWLGIANIFESTNLSEDLSKLKPGSKVQMQGEDGIKVVYVRPYNNQAFAGYVDGETKVHKWYYKNIKELVSESWNTTNIDESTSFTTYLKEAGYTLMEYQEQVYHTCLAKGNYTNIDLYFADDIEQGYNENKPVNEVADEICNKFDEFVNNVDTIEVDEPEYSQEQLQAFVDYPQDRFEDDEDYDENASEFNESTEQDDGISDGESYNEWKTDVFKYIDKRLDVNKIKELGSYIKDFIKQEYDNGEPSWFMCAESIVNYARIKYPEALKNRESNAFNITESADSQVYVVTFETEDEASEQEYELRDNCGSIVDTALDGNKVYIIPNNRAGLTIIKDWFGDNATLADNADEIVDTYFNMNESVRSLTKDEVICWVEFKTEDGAYDAYTAWNKMKNPSIKPMSAFDPDTIAKMKQYRTYQKVDVNKLENKLMIAAPNKKLAKMTQEWLFEVNGDAVSEISKVYG